MSPDFAIPFGMGLCTGVIVGVFILALAQWSKDASHQDSHD